MNNSGEWTLKKLIKKADDVDLNIAIALSKSLSDEEKAKKRRLKKDKSIPLNLMKEAKQVQKILSERFSHILQYSTLFEYQLNQSSTIWDKSSLFSEISPGELSYNDINESEKLAFYVNGLSDKISPAEYRMGDKVISMSEIPGRDCSQIIMNTSISSHQEVLSVTDASMTKQPELICENSIGSIDTSRLDSQEIVNDDKTGLSLKNASPAHCNGFMNMFNNSKFSDMFILLKSGAILRLHKFVFAAWKCDDKLLQEDQWFISDIDDDIPIQIFKHLYSNGSESIDDIIDTEECEKICNIFGILHSSLIRKTARQCTPIKEQSSQPSTCDFDIQNFSNPSCELTIDNNSMKYELTNLKTPESQIIKHPIFNNNSNLSPSGTNDDTDCIEDCNKTDKDSKLSNNNPNFSQASVDLFESTYEEETQEIEPLNSECMEEKSSDLYSNDIVESTMSTGVVMKSQILHQQTCDKTDVNDTNRTPVTSPDCIIPKQFSQNNLSETPLPFFQRMGFKKTPTLEDGKFAIVDLCSDDNEENTEVENSVDKTNGSDKIENESREPMSPKKSVKRKSDVADNNKQPKLLRTDSKTTSDTSNSEKKSSKPARVRKKKSADPKQPVVRKIGDKIVDTPQINKLATDICLKKSLSKKHKLLILQKVHEYQTKQNNKTDTKSSSDSSSCGEEDANCNELVGEFVMTQRTQGTQVEETRDWSPELHQFLKNNYYRDILTYKPLNIDTIHKELSMNNIKIDLKGFMDYLDAKCVAYQHSATTNKVSHPKVARRMVL